MKKLFLFLVAPVGFMYAMQLAPQPVATITRVANKHNAEMAIMIRNPRTLKGRGPLRINPGETEVTIPLFAGDQVAVIGTLFRYTPSGKTKRLFLTLSAEPHIEADVRH